MEHVHLSQLLAATQGTLLGQDSEDDTFDRVSTDTRTMRAGDVFWALVGNQYDGHNFVGEAQRKGACVSVVEKTQAARLSGPRVAVENTLTALGDFARWYRHQRESLVIGVTGSVGKTTTREMIHAVLSGKHAGTQSRNNYNNEVGLPLSLLDMQPDDDFGVFEMGACRVGDIRNLCEIACPEVGVLTFIGEAHLASFGGLDAISLAKGELLDSLPSHGFAVINGDDERTRAEAKRASCPVIFVGEKQGNQLRATEIEVLPQQLKFTVDRKRYELPVTGRHYLTAGLSAMAVAREIGMDANAIAAGFRKFKGQPGRCQVVPAGPWTIIDDTYNASPTSMRAAARLLQGWPAQNKRLLIVGDMLELGPEAAQHHRAVGADIATAGFDRVLALGTLGAEIIQGAMSAGMSASRLAECPNTEPLEMLLDCWLEPGDVILVKGSRGMRMERVVEWLKQRAAGQETATRTPQRAVA